MKTLRFFSCSLALLVALVSCNINSPEAIIDDVNKLQENSLNTINVVDQLFQFKDLPTLFNIAMQYQSDPEKFENLHKSRQFIALKDIYDEITAEEAYFHEHVQNITEENKTSLLTKGYMGKKAKSYSDMFTFSSTEGIIMRTPYPVLSIFLSPKGLVKIGDDIYQFKDQTIKVITGGDIKKVAYLDKINSTDNSIGIQVRPIQYLPIKSVKQGEVTVQSTQGATPQYVQSGNTFARSADNCIGNPCEYRVIGYENFTAPSGGSGQYIHTTTLRNLKRGFLGYWYDNNQNNETGNINGHLNFRTGVFSYPNFSNSIPNYNVTGYGATVSASYTFTLPDVNTFVIDSAFIFACPSVYCQLY